MLQNEFVDMPFVVGTTDILAIIESILNTLYGTSSVTDGQVGTFSANRVFQRIRTIHLTVQQCFVNILYDTILIDFSQRILAFPDVFPTFVQITFWIERKRQSITYSTFIEIFFRIPDLRSVNTFFCKS